MTVTPRHRAFWGNSEAYGTATTAFRVDWQEFAALLSERTRLVILTLRITPVQLSGSRLISPLCAGDRRARDFCH